MTVYVDVPRWQRWHGLSGHMVSDSQAELHALAARIGLEDTAYFAHAVVPHYQLPVTMRDQAIARGAIALDDYAFKREVRKLASATEAPVRERATRAKRRDKRRKGRPLATPAQIAEQGSLF